MTQVFWWLLFFGLLDFSVMMYVRQQITHAIREGGRWGIIGTKEYKGVDYTGRLGEGIKQVAIDKSAGLLKAGDLSITHVPREGGTPQTSGDYRGGATITVTAQKDIRFLVPLSGLLRLVNPASTQADNIAIQIQQRFVAEDFGS